MLKLYLVLFKWAVPRTENSGVGEPRFALVSAVDDAEAIHLGRSAFGFPWMNVEDVQLLGDAHPSLYERNSMVIAFARR